MDIVILHGWGHNAAMWQGFASKFHGYKITVFDLPGFGNEPLISEKWEISDYAIWVAKKLKAKKLHDVILIGHSFGGKIATEVAISNPDLVKKLILIAAPVLRRPSLSTRLKVSLHKIAKRVILKNALNIITNEEYRDAHKNKMGKIFVNSVNYDATNKLNRIKTNTLIIWGEDDPNAPLFIGKEMAELITNCQLEILKNTGHNIQLENPNILYGLVKKFITHTQ